MIHRRQDLVYTQCAKSQCFLFRWKGSTTFPLAHSLFLDILCPGFSSATHATTSPSRHTYGLSIVLAPESIWRFSYNGLVSKIAIALPYSRAHGSRPFLYAKHWEGFAGSVWHTAFICDAVTLPAHYLYHSF